MECKICNVLKNLDRYEIIYESLDYVVIVCPITNLPILVFKEHGKYISGDEVYKTRMEFGNLAEHRFGTRHLNINRRQGDYYNHVIWVACPIDDVLEKGFKEYPGFLEQWIG